MFDPISLIALGGIAAVRIWSGHNKKQASAVRAAAAYTCHEALLALQASSERMLATCNALFWLRLGSMRTLVDRLIFVARRIDTQAKIFDPETGWFAGKPYDEIRQMVLTANKVYVPPSQVAAEAELVLWGVVGLQGLEFLDKFSIVPIPLLNESLHDVVAHLPFDGAGHAADLLGHAGAGAMHVADALGVVGIAFSAFRIFSNIGSAADMRGDAASMYARADKADKDRRKFNRIDERGSEIQHGLDEASYDAFKWSWIANEVILAPESDPSSQIYRTTLRKFENATRQFWAFLSIPLLNEKGKASKVSLPIYQTV